MTLLVIKVIIGIQYISILLLSQLCEYSTKKSKMSMKYLRNLEIYFKRRFYVFDLIFTTVFDYKDMEHRFWTFVTIFLITLHLYIYKMFAKNIRKCTQVINIAHDALCELQTHAVNFHSNKCFSLNISIKNRSQIIKFH